MNVVRNPRWHCIIIDKGYWLPRACVMDDFGNAVSLTYKDTRISLRAGDA